MTTNYLDAKRLQGLSEDTVETLTLSDDFSSYADQASADAVWVSNNNTYARVNVTNDNLAYTFNVGDTFLAISKDLTTVNNSAFVIRFKLRFSTLTTGNTNAPFMDIGLSSTQNTTMATSTNRIYMRLKFDTDDKKFGGIDSFNSSISDDDGDDSQAFVPVISTNYFFEIARTSDTAYTIKRYSDSTYATVSQTSSGSCDSGLTNLIYFNISTHAGGTAGNITGTFDDFKFWNGVTSVTILAKPTNVQTNSIFEETDISAKYWYDGSVWLRNGSPSVSKIGVFGGSNAPNIYTTNYETLNLSTNVWTSSGSLTAARARTGTGSTISDAYVIGGQSSSYSSTVEKINWSTNGMTSTSDTTYAPSHTSANAPTFCQILSYYYASYFTNTRKYTYTNNSSVAGTSLSYSHAFNSAWGDKNAGYVTNGYNNGSNHTEKYTYSSDTVTQMSNPPNSNTGASGGHSGNKTTGVQCDSTNAHLYNLSTDVWTTNGFTGMQSVTSGTAVGSTFEDYYMMGTSTNDKNTMKKNYSSNTYTSVASFANKHNGDATSGACNDNWGVNY